MSDSLTITIKEDVHEVDSIIDCKRSAISQSPEALRIQLEMCCECHAGRPLWFSYDTVMRDGNKALKQLTKQTVCFLLEGLEIRSTESPSCVMKIAQQVSTH